MQVIRFIETNTNKFIGYLNDNHDQYPAYKISNGLQEMNWDYEMDCIEEYKNTCLSRRWTQDEQIMAALVRSEHVKMVPKIEVTVQLLDLDTTDITCVKSSVIKQFDMVITSDQTNPWQYIYNITFPETGVTHAAY